MMITNNNNSKDELEKGENSSSSFSNLSVDAVKNRKAIAKGIDKGSTAVKNGTKKAIANAKQLSSHVPEIEKLIASGIKSLIGSFGTPVIIFLLVLSVLPLGIIGSKYFLNEDLENTTDKVANAIKESFDAVRDKNDTKIAISDIINSSYGLSSDMSNLNKTDSGLNYSVETINNKTSQETYNIEIKFSPDINTIARTVAAYGSAVDGTLAYFTDDPREIDPSIKKDDADGSFNYDQSVIPPQNSFQDYIEYDGKDENGIPKFELTDDYYDFMESNKTEFNSTSTDEFANSIKEASSEFFRIEPDTHQWNISPLATSTRTEKNPVYEDVCYRINNRGERDKKYPMSTCIYYQNTDKADEFYIKNELVGYDTKIIQNHTATIEVPILYDVSNYKREELNELSVELTKRNQSCSVDVTNKKENYNNCIIAEADESIGSVLMNYYGNALGEFNATDYTHFGGSFGGIAGVSGSLGYSGDFDYNLYASQDYYPYSSTVAQLFWNHALSLNRQGLIHGSTTNVFQGCTLFAQAWFYDHYGFNSSGDGNSGNGNTFASKIIETYPDKFAYGSSASAGSIVSIDRGLYGHVVCVDAVDYDKNYIVFSEGNYNRGGVRIMVKMPLSEFYTEFGGRYIYANPIQ